jgi:pimeloyl-ACP methyl ester carboxylesterase
MTGALPSARTAAIAGAGHDLHLEQPSPWREVVSGFLETLSA